MSIFEASCILYCYEQRTGEIVGKAELDSGALKHKLIDSDYDTKCLVSNSLSIYLIHRLQSTPNKDISTV